MLKGRKKNREYWEGEESRRERERYSGKTGEVKRMTEVVDILKEGKRREGRGMRRESRQEIEKGLEADTGEGRSKKEVQDALTEGKGSEGSGTRRE